MEHGGADVGCDSAHSGSHRSARSEYLKLNTENRITPSLRRALDIDFAQLLEVHLDGRMRQRDRRRGCSSGRRSRRGSTRADDEHDEAVEPERDAAVAAARRS